MDYPEEISISNMKFDIDINKFYDNGNRINEPDEGKIEL